MRQHLLFDLDGTLTDPQEGILRCIRHALEVGGYVAPPAPELLWCIGPPLHVSLAQLVPGASEAEIWRLVGFYRERFAKVGKFENAVYPPIPALLAGLQPTHKLFTATSKPVVFAREIIAHYGLAPYFTTVYGSELDGTRSDKAELIRYILEQERISPDDAIIIGDRKFDVLGAAKAGIRSVGITWGYGTRAELLEAGADAICNDTEELRRALASL